MSALSDRVIEPQRVLADAAMAAFRDTAKAMLERGWAVELLVDRLPEYDSYAVSLRYVLPRMPVPTAFEERVQT